MTEVACVEPDSSGRRRAMTWRRAFALSVTPTRCWSGSRATVKRTGRAHAEGRVMAVRV